MSWRENTAPSQNVAESEDENDDSGACGRNEPPMSLSAAEAMLGSLLEDSVDNLSMEVHLGDNNSRHPSEISSISYQNFLEDSEPSISNRSRHGSNDSVESYPAEFAENELPPDDMETFEACDLPLSDHFPMKSLQNGDNETKEALSSETTSNPKPNVKLRDVENENKREKSSTLEGSTNETGLKKRNSLEVRNNIPTVGEVKDYEKQPGSDSLKPQLPRPKVVGLKQSPGLARRVDVDSSETVLNELSDMSVNDQDGALDPSLLSSSSKSLKSRLKNSAASGVEVISPIPKNMNIENEYDYVKYARVQQGNSYVGMRLAYSSSNDSLNLKNPGDSVDCSRESSPEKVLQQKIITELNQGRVNEETLTEIPLNNCDYSEDKKAFTLSPENTECDSVEVESVTSEGENSPAGFPTVEDGLSSSQASDAEDNGMGLASDKSPSKILQNKQKASLDLRLQDEPKGAPEMDAQAIMEDLKMKREALDMAIADIKSAIQQSKSVSMETSYKAESEAEAAHPIWIKRDTPSQSENKWQEGMTKSKEAMSGQCDSQNSSSGRPFQEQGSEAWCLDEKREQTSLSLEHKSPSLGTNQPDGTVSGGMLMSSEIIESVSVKESKIERQEVSLTECLEINTFRDSAEMEGDKECPAASPSSPESEVEVFQLVQRPPLLARNCDSYVANAAREIYENNAGSLERSLAHESQKAGSSNRDEEAKDLNENHKVCNELCEGADGVSSDREEDDGYIRQDGQPIGYDSDDECEDAEGIRYTHRNKGKKYAPLQNDDSLEFGGMGRRKEVPHSNGHALPHAGKNGSVCNSRPTVNSEEQHLHRSDLNLSSEESSDIDAIVNSYTRPTHAESDTDEETDRLLQKQYQERDKHVEIPELNSSAKGETSTERDQQFSKAKEAAIRDPDRPEVLIEGVLFRARYLGSTQLVSEGQPSKAMRMMQAQEAVGRIKAPEGENQPSTDVDVFVSTEKIMVLNTDLQEIMMDHSLRTISYIADIGDILVIMARRRLITSPDDILGRRRRQAKILCHVFESDEAQLIAQSIGQAFQVAYMEFLKANGIEDPGLLKEMDYQDVLNQQEIYGEELNLFTNKDFHKEVIVPKSKNELLGIVIVESGWGSMVPTVVLANMMPTGPAARCGQLNIGDQIISINGVSLVGLPISACQTYIKASRTQTVVKLTVVPCPPVVEVLIKRPDVKYQLGFSVQNGVICSLLRGGIAERGGVRVGHRIIEINNQSVVAVPHEKIVTLLANSVGEIHMKTMPTSIYRLLTGQDIPHYL